MAALVGPRDTHLRSIEAAFPDAQIVVRGNEIHLDGPQAAVAARLCEELVQLLQQGHHLDEATLRRSIDMVMADERPSRVLTDEILRGTKEIGRASCRERV